MCKSSEVTELTAQRDRLKQVLIRLKPYYENFPPFQQQEIRQALEATEKKVEHV